MNCHLDLDFKWWARVSTGMIIMMGSPFLQCCIVTKDQWYLLSLSLCVHLSAFVAPTEYKSWNIQAPIIAITVSVLEDRADHNSSVVMWFLPHISLLTWQMWGTTPYHLQPISLITSHCFNCMSVPAILVSKCGVAICWAKYFWWNMIENVQGILCCCHCSYKKESKEI
jgi:hypothetical protein